MEINNMATIQLKHLTLVNLVNAAYNCGNRDEPVFIHIAGDPGIGKTFATKSVETVRGVFYFSASFTPNEYKCTLKNIAERTVLLIHDDVGRGNPKYTYDFLAAFCDITEGHTEHRQYKKNIIADYGFSAIFTSTTAWFYQWKDTMTSMGYLDRVLPLQLSLHPNTRKAYQTACQVAARKGSISNDPAPRDIPITEPHDPIELDDYNIDPRNLRNLLRLSCYLTYDEMVELINIVHEQKPKYSI